MRAAAWSCALILAVPFAPRVQQHQAAADERDQTLKRLSIEDLSSIDVTSTHAELTLRPGWRRGHTVLSIAGDNLLHGHHPEFGNLTPREEYPRSVFGQATWRF